MLKVIAREVGGVTLVKFSGKIDYNNFRSMKERLRSMLVGGRTKLIVDLEGVDFIDSSGLGALVSLSVVARKKRETIKLIGINDNILKLLEMTRLIQILDLYKTADEAIRSFESR